jgi:hypothetical protein
MYASTDIKMPLYSMPHLSFTITALLVSSLRKGFGFTGTVYKNEKLITTKPNISQRTIVEL